MKRLFRNVLNRSSRARVDCLILSRGTPPLLEFTHDVLQHHNYTVETLGAVEAAFARYLQVHPRIIMITYVDHEALEFINRVKTHGGRLVNTLAVLEEEPTLSLDRILESNLDDMILPPLTPFRLEGRLKINIRRAAMLEVLDQTEQDLSLTESMTRSILDTTVDGIVTINACGVVESFNRAAEKIFGYSAFEVIGKNVNMLMPSPDREEHNEYIRSYQETGHGNIIGIGREVQGRRKNGDLFPMDLAVSEMNLPDGLHYTGVIRDITDRRQLENQLLTLSEQERRRIGEDLHDGLGQMLTGLGLITKNLIHKLEKKEAEELQDARELLEMLKDADEQAQALTRTLVPVDIAEGGFKAAIIRVKSNIETLYNIQVNVEFVGTIPALPPERITHFYKIILEAIENASMHSHGNQIRIVILGSPEKLLARVQDNGIGIDMEYVKSKPGMGLRIMKHRASLIGASLDVRKGTPVGTILTCTLPVSNGYNFANNGSIRKSK